MKLFTSLTAGAALTQAQDFPGFGGSLADLLAQLNIENQLDLGLQTGTVNDVNANATEGEFDPITGERYLIAQTPSIPLDEDFSNDDCENVTNDASEDCNPCMFDGSVCNGSKNACFATEEINGVISKLGVEDGKWIYRCDCTKYDGPNGIQHKEDDESDTWAGPECNCTACNPHDQSTGDGSGDPSACSNPSPCAEKLQNDIDNNVNNNINENANDVCHLSDSAVDGDDWECECDSGFHGQTCDQQHPCLTHDKITELTAETTAACNGAPGWNNNDECECVCSGHSENNIQGQSTDTIAGEYCNQRPCHEARFPTTCLNGGVATEDVSQPSASCACVCPPNYSGVNCGTDDCGAACQNNGIMDRNTCTCSCPSGWTGDKCETAVGLQPTGTGCWKCDAMTYVQCATEGTFQICQEENVNNVCFVEYREQNQKLTQLCTGCKETEACENLRSQNFVPGFDAGNTAPYMRMRNQCKPDYRLQVSRRRYGNTQSVCRQCFNMCSNDTAENSEKCFGGLGNPDATTTELKIEKAQWIRYNANIVGQSAWSGSTDKLLRKGSLSANEAIVLGIPLHHATTNADDNTFINSDKNHVFRGFSKTALNAHISNDVFNPSGNPTNEPLYWALADSTDYFWSKDLVFEQNYYNGYTAGNSAFEDRGYDKTKPCELDYGADKYCDRN